MTPPKRQYRQHIATEIVIHHNGHGSNPNIPHFRGVETIRGIDRWHTVNMKFNAIGYHRIIAPNGDVYEGRPLNVTGAHVRNANTGKIGIMLFGNFDYEEPTVEQLLSLENEIKLMPNTIKKISGHLDHVNTLCPGKNLYNLINKYKATGNFIIDNAPAPQNLNTINLEKNLQTIKKYLDESLEILKK